MNQDRAQHGRASVARNAGVISLAVTASRVLGFVRDQVFAALFGAGLQYDAFLTAFRIPNLLRDLFAEGALSAAFVTTFTQVQQSKGRRRPRTKRLRDDLHSGPAKQRSGGSVSVIESRRHRSG